MTPREKARPAFEVRPGGRTGFALNDRVEGGQGLPMRHFLTRVGGAGRVAGGDAELAGRDHAARLAAARAAYDAALAAGPTGARAAYEGYRVACEDAAASFHGALFAVCRRFTSEGQAAYRHALPHLDVEQTARARHALMAGIEAIGRDVQARARVARTQLEAELVRAEAAVADAARLARGDRIPRKAM